MNLPIVTNFLLLIVLVCISTMEYDFVFANNNNITNGEVITRCINREREALLKFKEGLIDDHGMTSSWGSKDKECCKWKGVRCSNTTHHVIALQLVGHSELVRHYHLYFDDGIDLGGEINSALLGLHNLKVLDLSGNNFGFYNEFPEFICSMTQLQHLNLSGSNYVGTLPSQLWNLTNLRTLDLSSNGFSENALLHIGNLTNLEILDISYNYFSGNISLQRWSSTNLVTLDLSRNQFYGTPALRHIGNLINLETLDLSDNEFSGIVPIEIGNLVNLKILDLSFNQFSGTVPPEIGNLTNLETLDLSYNQFSGIVPLEIGNLVNLKTLSLYSNEFSRIVHPQLWSLTNLETLDLSRIKLSEIVHPQLWNLTKLKTLDLSGNDLTSSTIDSLLNLSTNHVAPSLRKLNLGRNKLKRLPSSIWQLSNLEVLDVSFNSLEDTITEADLTKLPNLRGLGLSSNSLTLDISPDWTPPFQLTNIGLSGCKVGPHFPLWLQTQTNFTTLDLSVTGISGEVPKWFSSLSHQKVTYLNLSHNQLSGTISHFSSTLIEFLDISYNKFSGPIPSLSPSYSTFQISQNMFSGSLSFNCSIPYDNLGVLDLSNNQLSGKLPNCWENMTYISILNLSNNSFSGEIPHALGNLSELWTLHLDNNNFSGELPSTLKNCEGLEFIDIGDNMLTGSIPTWIGEHLERLVYLIIRKNMFHGSIPPQICYLSQIQVLDFSGNNISGEIPPCFHNFTYLVDNNITGKEDALTFGYIDEVGIFDLELIEYTRVNWKGKESEYGKNGNLLKLIDLSNNRITGNIPRSFSSLKGLRSLNLSGNRLTGIIDPDIGQMSSLDSLDLSSNNLSGGIPISMTKLNFLGVLDLANNNLSGKIPVGGHLDTFTTSAYAGNIGLCGSPLQPCPGDDLHRSTNNKAQHNDDDGGILSLSFLKEFGISVILGFIFGFWGVVGSLIVKESWRRAFYNFWGSVGDWVYVRPTIFWTNLFRRN